MKVNEQLELINAIASFRNEPYKFVLFAFEWSEGELANFNKPEPWQIEVLKHIGKELQAGKNLGALIQIAVASGHGVGKSALVSWLILWALATFPNTKVVVTANTESQLRNKTWAELAKWYRLCLCKDWFELTATSIFSKEKEYSKTWRADAITWNINTSEGFAGLHNRGKRILIIFDEASAIPEVIWEVARGATTDKDTQIIWAVFGNPTRNTGAFRECFAKMAHRWKTFRVDSRSVSITDKEEIENMLADYGENSDFVRVRIKGEFPNADNLQFIPSDLVELARGKHLQPSLYDFAPKLIGLDVARFGDDRSVITKRQGLYCHVQKTYRQVDTQLLASIAIQEFNDWGADYIFVDGVGIGAGVVDRIRTLGYGASLIDCQAGSRAADSKQYANKRAEMWGRMLAWFKAGGAIPESSELADDLIAPEYSYNPAGALLLEKKEDMKKRGLSSPDCADSLALTFYEEVVSKKNLRYVNSEQEYNPLEYR